MADAKVTGLAALTSPATDDLVPVVDISDTSMAASGTDKKVEVGLITSSSGTADPSTAAAAGATYWQVDAAGQVVAVWRYASGAWTKILGSPPFADVRRAAAQTAIANNTLTDVSFDTETEDTDGMASLTSPTRPITIVRAGVYRLSVSHNWPASATGARDCFVCINNNGTVAPGTKDTRAGATTSFTTEGSAGAPVRLAVNDVLFVRVRQTSGGAMDLNSCRLTALYVRP